MKPEPHKPLVLSAKAVTRSDTGQCPLLRRSQDSKGNRGKWESAGGKAESGESFEKGLLREIAEGTGSFVSVGRVPGATESESPTARVVYLIFEG